MMADEAHRMARRTSFKHAARLGTLPSGTPHGAVRHLQTEAKAPACGCDACMPTALTGRQPPPRLAPWANAAGSARMTLRAAGRHMQHDVAHDESANDWGRALQVREPLGQMKAVNGPNRSQVVPSPSQPFADSRESPRRRPTRSRIPPSRVTHAPSPRRAHRERPGATSPPTAFPRRS